MGPKHAGSEQLDGAERHAKHLEEQRVMRLGTLHGTDQSRRGARLRQRQGR